MFKADQLIQIKFYYNRWRTSGTNTHTNTDWIVHMFVWAANQDFAFVSIVCLFSACASVSHRIIQWPMCCVCVFIFGFCLWSCSEQLRRVANMTVLRNDDVCKGNFDGQKIEETRKNTHRATSREKTEKRGRSFIKMAVRVRDER